MKEKITDIINAYEDVLKMYMLPIERDEVRKQAVKDIVQIHTSQLQVLRLEVAGMKTVDASYPEMPMPSIKERKRLNKIYNKQLDSVLSLLDNLIKEEKHG